MLERWRISGNEGTAQDFSGEFYANREAGRFIGERSQQAGEDRNECAF
jgi:hypothetical protein